MDRPSGHLLPFGDPIYLKKMILSIVWGFRACAFVVFPRPFFIYLSCFWFLLALSLRQRLCMKFLDSSATFLTTLRSHLDLRGSYIFFIQFYGWTLGGRSQVQVRISGPSKLGFVFPGPTPFSKHPRRPSFQLVVVAASLWRCLGAKLCFVLFFDCRNWHMSHSSC